MTKKFRKELNEMLNIKLQFLHLIIEKHSTF